MQRQEFLWLRALCPRDMGSATAVSDLTSQPCGAATVFSAAEGALGSVMTSPAGKHRTRVAKTLEVETASRQASEGNDTDSQGLRHPQAESTYRFQNQCVAKSLV